MRSNENFSVFSLISTGYSKSHSMKNPLSLSSGINNKSYMIDFVENWLKSTFLKTPLGKG